MPALVTAVSVTYGLLPLCTSILYASSVFPAQAVLSNLDAATRLSSTYFPDVASVTSDQFVLSEMRAAHNVI